MTKRRTNRNASRSNSVSNPVSAEQSLSATMSLIRARLIALSRVDEGDPLLFRVEAKARHIRKIIEGVAFAALSHAEYRNGHPLPEQRTKDADKLLNWLDAKKMLRLPKAQRLEPSPSPDYKAVLAGAPENDLLLVDLKSVYSRASNIIHERHPERLTKQVIEDEGKQLDIDANRLRDWLWLHMTFAHNRALLIQMGQFDTSSFIVPLDREGDLPQEYSQGEGDAG